MKAITFISEICKKGVWHRGSCYKQHIPCFDPAERQMLYDWCLSRCTERLAIGVAAWSGTVMFEV